MTWRVLSAVLDTERKGRGLRGIAARAYYMGTAIMHAMLAAGVIAVLRGARSSGGHGDAARSTATAMHQPFGRWLVIAAGLALLGYATYQVYKGWMTKLGKSLDLDRIEPDTRKWIVAISRFGLAARGLVFGVMGWFLARAGLRHDPGEARGVGEALSAFDGSSWILASVAVGLAAYGVYMLVKAKYRRIRTA